MQLFLKLKYFIRKKTKIVQDEVKKNFLYVYMMYKCIYIKVSKYEHTFLMTGEIETFIKDKVNTFSSVIWIRAFKRSLPFI